MWMPGCGWCLTCEERLVSGLYNTFHAEGRQIEAGKAAENENADADQFIRRARLRTPESD